MLNEVNDLPMDKRIASVHCIPITENGSIVMAWDNEEQLLTTIGGRIDAALKREAMEEEGIIIGTERVPFASWYWKSSDTYTIWYLVKVEKFLPHPFDCEKSGYVIFNLETAKQLISKTEPDNDNRIQILNMAYDKVKLLNW
ncbi:NUDIX hydrolase [Solibacillus sp. FSL H8-0538]|uniref:NUDIX hydrolase n=1 Tax=Solibacillus sp. FSL H8-0538 TaxID=2921400 RepID=UPI0030F5D9C1